MTVSNHIILTPYQLCETQNGDLAHTVGRVILRPGRPMLVEHLGGIYLEHDLAGKVLTPGYGPEYNIVHIRREAEDGDESEGALPAVIRMFL